MAAINTTNQHEEKVPLLSGVKERFSKGFGVVKNFASRVKTVLETPVSQVAKNAVDRTGDFIHGVEYAMATKINNLLKPARIQRPRQVEPESWGGEFVDDAASLKIIDFAEAKEKLPEIQSARLAREAYDKEQAALKKGALMTFAAGKIKEKGIPTFSESKDYDGKVGHATVPDFMNTEFGLTQFINNPELSVGALFDTIRKHYDTQRERGDIAPMNEEDLARLNAFEQDYRAMGFYESFDAKKKWQYLLKFFDDCGVMVMEHHLLGYIGSKNKDILWNHREQFARVPEFFQSKQSLHAFVSNPQTTAKIIFDTIENHFNADIEAGIMKPWTENQESSIRFYRAQFEEEGLFADRTEEELQSKAYLSLKWGLVTEFLVTFGFDIDNNPLAQYCEKQSSIQDKLALEASKSTQMGHKAL
ncbi:hypothetical protein COW46_05145 [Candidatus Gracilibacteria bacterium CG17_big_fil_post_rev_8_21_14_2_50_48_13]|nr:MAG: hypothetical protein COW46_05145 [Candidatus Gracilibacteria bacterium CG17_big_fil_post_rev_8_21_14_2_50_48_13]